MPSPTFVNSSTINAQLQHNDLRGRVHAENTAAQTFQKMEQRDSQRVVQSNKSEKERRFNHLEEIFKSLKMPIIKCFQKCCEWKQSDKKLSERANIQKVIKIDKSLLKGVKRVLIVDDVLTSGSTIRTMIKQIPSNIDKKVLVLSSNCRVLTNEII